MSEVILNGSVSENLESSPSSRALKLQTETPHLVSMGGDRLSTSVTLHPIPQGRIVLGSSLGADILVQGTGVSPIHCHIGNNEGIVTIYPLADNISIDGVQITTPTRLSQGAMLTIGRSNYLRFNHPAEAKLMKSVLPNNPRISMPSITFETAENPVNFVKKPPTVPKKLPNDSRESFSDSGGEDPPSSFMTKLSKFEYLAAQNLKKTISPKVFTSNAVTVNTPAKDVLGKSPPDLCNFTKNLPQSALNNYTETNNNNELRKLSAKKSSQYVNVTLNDTKSINNRVMLYENGMKPNVNIDDNDYLLKTSCGNKNINVHRVITPSPGYNRNPGPYNRSVTPSPISKTINELHRKSGSLDQLTNGSYYENNEDLNERKKEAEIKRNQAQQDRIKEEEQKRAEQARLEEILNMCAEYEKQSQHEKNKPITPNRIKTNGSLPRDKRQSPYSSSPYNTPPSSPGVFDFQQRPNNSYENAPSFNHHPIRTKIISNYENIEITPPFEQIEQRKKENYENVQTTPTNYPNSPRTRIKTFLPVNKDTSPKEDNIAEKEQNVWENLNQKSYNETQKKVPQSKFILPLDEPEKLHEKTEKLKSNRGRYESLKREKAKLLDIVGSLKTLMSEIEIQEEELHIEMDMERALLSGEHKSKTLDLENLNAKKENLAKQAQKIEAAMADAQLKQTEHEKTCREKLKTAQDNMEEIETKLKNTEKTSENYESVFESYLKCQEVLDSEKKSFEDLEFHHLEEEANWLATREELQRDVVEITRRIDHLKTHLDELERQSVEAANSNNIEYKSLESQKINCLVKLEEIRNRLKDIDEELAEFSEQESEHESSDSESSGDKMGNFNKFKGMSSSIVVSDTKLSAFEMFNMSHSFNDKLMQDQKMLEDGIDKRYPSQDDIDRISKVTSDSPIDIASLNRKTVESLKELERNRHLHLCQQGSQVIEQERQRVQALKERAQQEVRSQWAQRIQDCSSITSTGSEGTVSGEKTDDSNNEKVETKTNTTNEIDSCRHNENNEEHHQNHRPLSEVSEMSLEGSVGTFKKRGKTLTNDKQRPLTRYLPIRGSDLDLRQHIESAGHQVVLCPHVLINSTSCRGFLNKKGSKLNGWSRRWFVFDRNKHTFSYYADKNEKKARGGAYFQAIEEVYLDHSKSVKSPNPQLTFIVKTHERYYYLMAPSPEAMRIWVDVIFTGAEGYQEFEYGS